MHDMEALWWVASYFLVTKDIPGIEDPGKKARLRSQRILASDLFWHGSARHDFMVFRNSLASKSDCLHPSLRPFAQMVEDARMTLLKTYHRVEEDVFALSFDVAIDDVVYNRFASIFKTMSQTSSRDLTLEDISHKD